MPPRAHALLSASSAHRWMACPPSARLEEGKPDTKSESAAEGTLAHSIVETKLNRLIAGKRAGKATLDQKNHELYRPVMEEHTDFYIDYVMELYAQHDDALLMSEKRVDFSDVVPDGFGTTDTIIIADGTMHVIDFKYGKHVLVEAAGNPQLRLYAWGAYREYGMLYDIKQVDIHIVQPRMDNVSSETISIAELTDWAYDTVEPVAKLAMDGRGEYTPGAHCFFCKAQATCQAYVDRQNLTMAYMFTEPDELSDADVAELIPRVAEFKRWATKFDDWVLSRAVNHGIVPTGYKLVEGRANQRITDLKLAAQLLREHGIDESQMYNLKGLGDLEDVVGKKQLSEMLGDLIVKPQGKPTLAPDSDKRPAISSATRAAELFND